MLSFFYLVSAILIFSASPLRKYQLHGKAQGTTWSLTYYAPQQSPINAARIDSIFKKIDSSLSLYKPHSLINQFNRSATGIPADPHLIAVVRKSIETYKLTHGIFDITVKPFVDAWGFGTSPHDHIPDTAELQALQHCVGSNRLLIRNDTLLKTIPCLSIDLNGIAQGYTVDQLAGFLLSQRINNFIVELGGEIRVHGRHQPSGKFMRVGIEAPSDDRYDLSEMQTTITLSEGAITSSGSYRKFKQSGNRTISHLMDPRTGHPVSNELISVTVFAPDAITADAYDNALMGMGLYSALQFVEQRRDLGAYFIYLDQQGNVRDTACSQFKKLF